MKFMKKTFFFLPFVLLVACKNDEPKSGRTSTYKAPKPIRTMAYNLETVFPHDETAFTEGLSFYQGELWESTGSPEEMKDTRSLIGKVDSATGKLNPVIEIDRNQFFGEGFVHLNGKIYQLTYQKKVGFVYDAETFEEVDRFPIPGEEGWGMTTDGKSLIMSDGTDYLYFLDPASLQVSKKIQVLAENTPLQFLNELEWVDGAIYANVYTTNTIVKINPTTGAVEGQVELSELARDARQHSKRPLEMNGIAYNKERGTFYVTGKMWSSIYEISLY